MDASHTSCIMVGVTIVGVVFCFSSCQSNQYKYASEQKKEEMLMIQHMAAQGLVPHYDRMKEIDGWVIAETLNTVITGEKQ